jgi:hypothetical protein
VVLKALHLWHVHFVPRNLDAQLKLGLERSRWKTLSIMPISLRWCNGKRANELRREGIDVDDFSFGRPSEAERQG